MKQITNNALKWAKSLGEKGVNGCITGSCLLNYFEGQDIDIFVYDEGSFNETLYCMQYDKMFQILEPLELFKLQEWKKTNKVPYKFGMVTIKYKYNLTVDVNVIYKVKNKNVFDVISNFDLDIICKGYDLKTNKLLDLSENLPNNKVTWNKWNNRYYSEEIWTINSLLRQFSRCIKYYKRGYNTDEVSLKYLELLDKLLYYKNIFNSESFDEKVKVFKHNAKIMKNLIELWLENHQFSEKDLEELNNTIKKL